MPQVFQQLQRALLAILLALLSSGLVAAERYYGSTGELELRIEDDLEAAGVFLQVSHFDSTGRLQPLMLPLRLKKHHAKQEFSGTALALGAAEKVRFLLSEDGQSLSWLQPKQLRLINGGTVQMAGEHPLLDERQRLSASKRHFAEADKQLNAAYQQLRKRFDSDAFSDLRSNQRRWLKYRDLFVADGDDSDINGPGSVPFLRQQIIRTQARVEFLQALGRPRVNVGEPSGRYSDGIDRELRLQTIPAASRQLFFSVSAANPHVHDGEMVEPLTVSGLASASANGDAWMADGTGVNVNPVVTADGELLIEPEPGFHSVLLSSASSPVLTGRLHFLEKLQPATEPMRGVLLRLPAAAFDHTTEGLSDAELQALLLDGRSGPFELEDAGADSIRVNYGEGNVRLHRFARHDGDAWVAVETSNRRARSFELWELLADQPSARRLKSIGVLPKLTARDFFENPDAAAQAQGRIDLSLIQDQQAIEAIWLVDDDGPAADYVVELRWDGFGFGGSERRQSF